MAGDLSITESLIVVAPGGGHAFAAGTPLLHEYGPRLKIGLGGSEGHRGAPIDESALTSAEQQGLSAYRLRLSSGYKAGKAKRPYHAAPWGGAQDAPSLHADRQFMIRGAPSAPDADDPAEAPEAKRLAGRVAVGLIIVSGPGQLAMSGVQQQKIVAEVQNGLSYLGSQSPSRDVTFVYDIQTVEIDIPDTTAEPPAGASINDRYEHYERPWRDAALAKLGFAAAGNGIRTYIRKIKAAKQADAAYCAFFTHYSLEHFAYCSGSYLTMQFANDGWGPDNLDSVFAHETGHVFGAPDEYAESDCNCGGSWGFFGRPNLNCDNCADGGGVPCLMKRNTWAMCSETPFHLGYRMAES